MRECTEACTDWQLRYLFFEWCISAAAENLCHSYNFPCSTDFRLQMLSFWNIFNSTFGLFGLWDITQLLSVDMSRRIMSWWMKNLHYFVTICRWVCCVTFLKKTLILSLFSSYTSKVVGIDSHIFSNISMIMLEGIAGGLLKMVSLYTGSYNIDAFYSAVFYFKPAQKSPMLGKWTTL